MTQKAGDVYIELGARISKLEKNLSQAERKTKQSAGKIEGGMSKAFMNIGATIAGVFAVGQLIDFQKKIIAVTSEFQRLEAVLSNTLGSASQADLAFAKIRQFAKDTPFSVQELTDSFVRLTNQGFQPTIEEMTKLGDLASSTGKGFVQLAEAIIDAQVGEFERLKEFGVRASKEGDKVTFTFKGLKEEVDFTASAIQNYLVGLGDLEGVTGAADKISKTLGGKINNLGDAIDNLYNTIGNAESGPMGQLVSLMIEAADKLEEIITPQFKKGKDDANALFEELKKGKNPAQDIGFALADTSIQLKAFKDRLKELQELDTRAYFEHLGEIEALEGIIAKTEGKLKTLTTLSSEYFDSLSKGKGDLKETTELTDEQREAMAKLNHEMSLFAQLQADIKAMNATEMADLTGLGGGGKFEAGGIDMSGLQEIPDFSEEFMMSDDEMQAFSEFLESTLPNMELMAFLQQQAAQWSTMLGQGFADALVNGENFGEVMGEVLKQMVQQLIAAVAQALILSAIMAAIPGLGVGLGFGQLFTQNLGGGLQLGGVLQGSSIFLSGQRGNNQNNRGGGF